MLDARRADVVVKAVTLLLQLVGLVGRDRAHVADDVGDQVAFGVAAGGLDPDLHAGHVELVLGDAHHRFAIHVRADGNGVEGVVVLARLVRLDDALDGVGRHPQLVADADDDLLHAAFGHVGGRDRDHKDGGVGRQQRLVSVVDDAALRRDDRLTQPVGGRPIGVRLAIDDLEPPELGGQQSEKEKDQASEEPRRRAGAAFRRAE